MRCPVDETELRMTERQGVEIDYCPKCRGVWLDRGELDKIIERGDSYAEAAAGPVQPPPVEEPPRRDWDDRGDRDSDDRYERPYERGPHRRRKRKGFLGDLFEFDD